MCLNCIIVYTRVPEGAEWGSGGRGVAHGFYLIVTLRVVSAKQLCEC